MHSQVSSSHDVKAIFFFWQNGIRSVQMERGSGGEGEVRDERADVLRTLKDERRSIHFLPWP